jgi:hypothetical protein
MEANLEVVREYLEIQFKGFELTETRDRPLVYTFTVTKSADERYQVKVSWPQLLSDQSNTPERTQQHLVTDDVAGRMRGKSQGNISRGGSAKSRREALI